MSEDKRDPRTEAGRQLIAGLMSPIIVSPYVLRLVRNAILDIEAEAEYPPMAEAYDTEAAAAARADLTSYAQTARMNDIIDVLDTHRDIIEGCSGCDWAADIGPGTTFNNHLGIILAAHDPATPK